MRAVVYIRLLSSEELQSLTECKERAEKYCEWRGYKLLVILEFIGDDDNTKQRGRNKVERLAVKGLVDVVIVPKLSTISDSIPEAIQFCYGLMELKVSLECLEYNMAERFAWQKYHRDFMKQQEVNRKIFSKRPGLIRRFIEKLKDKIGQQDRLHRMMSDPYHREALQKPRADEW